MDSAKSTLERITGDFPDEVGALEASVDAIDRCVLVLVEKVAVFRRSNLNLNLRQASVRVRRNAVRALLLYHAGSFLRAAHLLVLNGYPAPALSCLRTTVESTLNAHACTFSDDHAMKWVQFGKVDRSTLAYPRQFKDAKQILDALNRHGSHADYLAVGQQAYYEVALLSDSNSRDYEFLTLRPLHFCLVVSSRLLDYLVHRLPSLRREVPAVEESITRAREIADQAGHRLLGVLYPQNGSEPSTPPSASPQPARAIL